MTARIALATCSAYPNLPFDEPLLIDALRARGVMAEPAVWDAPGIDWSGYELVVVRSTWDYAARREAFLAWVHALPRVLNSPEVLRWNTDKRYLANVPGAVQTHFVAGDESWEAPAQAFVVKPAVSAGARDSARYEPAEAWRAHEHVAGLVAAGRIAMVQPYLNSVDVSGETALLYFAGRFSHAIRKGPLLPVGGVPSTELFVEQDVEPRVPQADELAAGDRVLDGLPFERDELLYARVDLIRGFDGQPQVVELELTEPSLYLSYADGAAARLAAEIIRRL